MRAPAEHRLGERDGEFAVEQAQLVGRVPAVAALVHVVAQIGVEVGTAAPEGDVEHAVVAAALLAGGEFVVDLQTALAQAFPGPPQFGDRVLGEDPQQGRGYLRLFGLHLPVPQQAAGRLGQPLERAGDEPPVLRRKQSRRRTVRAVLPVRFGQQFRSEQFTPLVHEPLGRYAADGDEQLGSPCGARPGLVQRIPEHPRE